MVQDSAAAANSRLADLFMTRILDALSWPCRVAVLGSLVVWGRQKFWKGEAPARFDVSASVEVPVAKE